MKWLFADTSYFIALLYPRDQYYRQAVALTENINVPLVTTQWVLAELGNYMCQQMQRLRFVEFMRTFEAGGENLVIVADDATFRAAVLLFESRADKEWSLVDCTSFVVMERLQLKDALAADQHFKQAGYHALLLDE